MRTITALLLALTLSGCWKGEKYQPDAAESRAMAKAVQASLRQVRGTFTANDITSIFVAYVDEKKVYLIEESMDIEGGAKNVNRYFLDEPALMVFESQKSVRVPGQVKLIDLEVFFDRQGGVTETRQAINGQAATPEQSEIDQAKARFKLLYPEVRRQSGL